ncbi:MAG: VCBS repeat-containing protein [Elusimicrobia bacterium]|nr:VCBS repeat-containing protein [Elusimicrobiota bacterium]
MSLDSDGNLYIADKNNHRVRFVARTDGTYFGQSMTANYIYTIAGNGTGAYGGDGAIATAAQLNNPTAVNLDSIGNVYIADTTNFRIRFIPKTSGTYFGQAMTANYIYTLAGNGGFNYTGDGGIATSATMKNPTDASVDAGGNVYISDQSRTRIRFIPKRNGTYFGQSMTANFIYTIGGTGVGSYNAENLPAIGANTGNVYAIFAASDHMLYLTESNNKIRMIAAADFIAPSTSALTAVPGASAGKVNLSWSSAGDDGPTKTLTGNYRIQYATYTASWSTGSTPSNAMTVTISTTNVTPGVVVSTTLAGVPGGTTYYFALFTGDEIPNWSEVSNTESALVEDTDTVSPSTSTLGASTGTQPGNIDLSWLSAGDDGGSGNLFGDYRIQYATYTASWSTSSTPSNATTVTISTINVVPGAAQGHTVTGLVPTTTYHFVLWSKDNMNNWSEISNSTSALPSTVGYAPSSSTLTAVTGMSAGAINLSWNSAGAEGMYNNLTGYYRIQYATYTATWSTSTTPANAYTSTVTATNVAPGALTATTIVVSPTTPQTWYFVLWTSDEAGNWSTVSSTVTASPPFIIPDYGVGPFNLASVGGGLSQGGTAWGDYDNDGDLDVVVSGTDGTNNQVRVYKSNGNGTFNSTAVNVAAANSGLKEGDVAFGDFDNDGDLDVVASGSDNSNNQLRVFRNNGNGTFNTTPVEVAGSNNGLKQGGVVWGDFDNDGDLDVLVSGTDGTNNQLRVYQNKGDGTFNGTGIDVGGTNNGLRQGSVAWGDFDQDGDLDVLLNGTDGTNRQLRVYANNGNGTFNSTAINVAGLNNGLVDGRWRGRF